MLRAGQIAPEFAARTTAGARLSLSDLRGRIAVIYFFRRAFTRNCTVETKGFRDNHHELEALGAEVVGISCDSFETQCRFATEHKVGFPMIADGDKAISLAYDVFFPLIPLSHRVTYVVDRDGVIAGVFNHEIQVSRHLDEVLRFTRELARASRRPPPR